MALSAGRGCALAVACCTRAKGTWLVASSPPTTSHSVSSPIRSGPHGAKQRLRTWSRASPRVSERTGPGIVDQSCVPIGRHAYWLAVATPRARRKEEEGEGETWNTPPANLATTV